MSRLVGLPAIAAALAVATTIPAVAADEATTWRLFVSDHASPVVTAIDLPNGDTVGRFDINGAAAALHATPSRAGVFAVQADAGIVSAIASGIELEDHGDHGDIDVEAPQLLDVHLKGNRPVHFVEHGGRIALFFDGTGTSRMLQEDAWLAGNVTTQDHITPAPHHGVAAPLGDFVLVSEPHPQDPSMLPIGINVLDSNGSRVGELWECPDLHGEAASGHTLAIACATGLLLIDEGAGAPAVTHLPYAANLPEGKATTLVGGIGLKYWLGNYGADRVVLIDPSEAAPFRLIDLPSRRVHFAIDPVRPKFAYIFTEDGQLHQLDVVSGTIAKSLPLTEPYSMDGEWSLPRPRVAVAGDVIAVTDPLAGRIRLVDAEVFALDRDLEVGGMPYSIVAVGGSGQSH